MSISDFINKYHAIEGIMNSGKNARDPYTYIYLCCSYAKFECLQ